MWVWSSENKRGPRRNIGKSGEHCWWSVRPTHRRGNLGTSLLVRCLGLLAPTAGAQVWSLVGELRSRGQKRSDDNKVIERGRKILKTRLEIEIGEEDKSWSKNS